MFNFPDKESLLAKSRELDVDLPYSDDLNILFEPVQIAGKKVQNRLCILPMEGCDADPDGAPAELTFRHYERFARGGAGLIWFEAAAVVQEGRSNPKQLFLHKKTLDGFKRLADHTRKSAEGREPLLILQLTHSGRFARPEGKARPDFSITDEELDELRETFIEASVLAAKAGFDGVDIKACHGYLISELLAAFERKDSRYGGSFENRARFLLEVTRQAREAAPDLLLACRLNAYDAVEGGFATDRNSPDLEDLAETKILIEGLMERGCALLGITLGIPYLKPHFGRPFNRPVIGAKQPDEHPLVGVARHIRIAGELQRSFPSMAVAGAGYSWLRHHLPNVGAGVLEQDKAALIGMGRGAFAYPDSVKDIEERGAMDPKMTCIACSCCTQIMRDGGSTGCVVRDKKVYGPIFREGRRLKGQKE